MDVDEVQEKKQPTELELAVQHIFDMTLTEYTSFTQRDATNWQPVTLYSAVTCHYNSPRENFKEIFLDQLLVSMYRKMKENGIDDAVNFNWGFFNSVDDGVNGYIKILFGTSIGLRRKTKEVL